MQIDKKIKKITTKSVKKYEKDSAEKTNNRPTNRDEEVFQKGKEGRRNKKRQRNIIKMYM